MCRHRQTIQCALFVPNWRFFIRARKQRLFYASFVPFVDADAKGRIQSPERRLCLLSLSTSWLRCVNLILVYTFRVNTQVQLAAACWRGTRLEPCCESAIQTCRTAKRLRRPCCELVCGLLRQQPQIGPRFEGSAVSAGRCPWGCVPEHQQGVVERVLMDQLRSNPPRPI